MCFSFENLGRPYIRPQVKEIYAQFKDVTDMLYASRSIADFAGAKFL